MRTTICLGLLLFLVSLMACRKAASMRETYTVEAGQNQLVAGAKQKIEVLVRYHRSQQPPATLKYTVQFSAPSDLTVTPTGWNVEQNLTANNAGFNYNGAISIEVAADAAPGERVVTATITPTQGTASTAALRFQVRKKGD